MRWTRRDAPSWSALVVFPLRHWRLVMLQPLPIEPHWLLLPEPRQPDWFASQRLAGLPSLHWRPVAPLALLQRERRRMSPSLVWIRAVHGSTCWAQRYHQESSHALFARLWLRSLCPVRI